MKSVSGDILEKRNIKIKGRSIPLDLYLLNALSLKHFDDWYDNSKKETNAFLRDLVKKEDNLHPKVIERYIFNTFLPKEIKGLLNRSINKKERDE